MRAFLRSSLLARPDHLEIAALYRGPVLEFYLTSGMIESRNDRVLWKSPDAIGELCGGECMSEDPSTISTVADLKAASSRDPAASPPQNARSDALQRPGHSAGWWFFVAVFLIYPLSIMPAYVALLVLRSRGIDLYPAYESFYRPVIWILTNVGWARRLSNLIEPMLRRLAP
jgi:hypothetical protein